MAYDRLPPEWGAGFLLPLLQDRRRGWSRIRVLRAAARRAGNYAIRRGVTPSPVFSDRWAALEAAADLIVGERGPEQRSLLRWLERCHQRHLRALMEAPRSLREE